MELGHNGNLSLAENLYITEDLEFRRSELQGLALNEAWLLFRYTQVPLHICINKLYPTKSSGFTAVIPQLFMEEMPYETRWRTGSRRIAQKK